MSALDANLREAMQVELRLLQQRLGITTIVVTHDQREAMTMADKIVVMSDGRVEQVGPPQDIYHKPANAFVADFIGRANFFEGISRGGRIEVGDLVLDAGSGRFLDGSPVTVAFRPETAFLDRDMAQANRVPGEIIFVRDIGSTRDIHLKTPLGPVIVEHAIGDPARSFAVGDDAEVVVPHAALFVYPGAPRRKPG